MSRIKIPTPEFPEAHVVYVQKHGGPDMKPGYQFWIRRDEGASKFPWTHPAAERHFPDGAGQRDIAEVESDAREMLLRETEKWKAFLKTEHGANAVKKLIEDHPGYNPAI